MRVSGNVPHFTIDLSSSFVNGFYWVSTGILPVSLGFVPFMAQIREFSWYLQVWPKKSRGSGGERWVLQARSGR
jgi:hypothetical protein